MSNYWGLLLFLTTIPKSSEDTRQTLSNAASGRASSDPFSTDTQQYTTPFDSDFTSENLCKELFFLLWQNTHIKFNILKCTVQ